MSDKRKLSQILVQTLNAVVMRSLYRLSAYGTERLPRDKGALLVCNHVSYLDACLIIAALRRQITFLIDRPIWALPIVKQFVSASGAIPIEAGSKRSEIESALDEATRLVAAGELVCIFAEGGITRSGELMPFRKGLEHIMHGLSEQIVPLYLDGMWGSIYSFKGGKFFWKLPRDIFSPVRIFVGEPIAGDSTASQVRDAVVELSKAVN